MGPPTHGPQEDAQQIARDLYLSLGNDLTPAYSQREILSEVARRTGRKVDRTTLYRWAKANGWDDERTKLQRQAIQVTDPQATGNILDADGTVIQQAAVMPTPSGNLQDTRDVVLRHVAEYVKNTRGLSIASFKSLADYLKRHMTAMDRLKQLEAMPAPISVDQAELRTFEIKAAKAMLMTPRELVEVARLGQVIQAAQVAVVMNQNNNSAPQDAERSKNPEEASLISFMQEAQRRGLLGKTSD